MSLATFSLSPQQSNPKWTDNRPLTAGHPSINSSFCSRFHWFHWLHFIPASTAHLSQSAPAAFRCPSQWQLWFSPSAPAAERFFCVPRPFLRAAKEWKLQSYSTVCSNQKNGQVIYQCFSRIWLSISLLGCYALKKQMELQGNLWFDERLFYFSKYSKALQSNMMSLKKNKGVSSLEHGSRKLIIYSSSSSPKSPIEMYKESNNPASTVVFNVATITCIIGDLTLKSQCSSYVLTSFAGLMY